MLLTSLPTVSASGVRGYTSNTGSSLRSAETSRRGGGGGGVRGLSGKRPSKTKACQLHDQPIDVSIFGKLVFANSYLQSFRKTAETKL